MEVVKLALEKGANIYGKDMHGKTAEHYATKEKHYEIIEYLKKKK